jgi:zinc protease
MITAVGGGLGASRDVLSNGAVVIVKSARTIPAVTIQAAIRAGSVYEPDEHLGLSHFVSRVIDRGTERRSAEEIAEILDYRGVALTINANRHVAILGCTCLAEDFERILEIVGEIAMRPAFPDIEIAKRRNEILTSIRQDEDSPAAMAMQGVFALLYPDGHPYGRPAKGRPETVERIDRRMLQGFHDARVAPSELSLVVVGDVEPGRAVEVANRVFGAWQKPAPREPELPHPAARSSRQQRVIPMMNKAQTDIAYGFTTITRSDPGFYAYTVMNNALGQYGIGGRLGDSIRERQGMAYYVYSSFDANVVEGPLVVRAGVNPANVERAIASIDAEMRRMAAEGLSAKELADCKQFIIGSIPRMLETNSAIATFLQTAEFFGLGFDHDLRLAGLIDAVTLEDVNAAARAALDPSRAAVVIAGPYQL